MTLAEKQARLIDDLSLVDDVQERLSIVLDRAKKRPPLSEAERNETTRVKACVSRAWIAAETRDGRCYFRSDADSPLVRGLLLLLTDFYDGAEAQDIVATEPDLLDKTGLTRSLSPTRVAGLRSAIGQIRDFASAQSR